MKLYHCAACKYK